MGKTTIVLGLIALGLLGFIVLYERETLSTAQLEERKGRVIREFARERIHAIEVQRGQGLLRLQREADPASDDGGFRGWKIDEPFSAVADEEAVDEMLAEIEWLQPLRTLQGISESDRKRFQLHEPRLRVGLSIANQRVDLLVGNDEPRGQGVYVQVAGQSVAYVVPKQIVETFDREPGHYHTKDLYALIVPAMVHELQLQTTDTDLRALRESDRWWLQAPDRVPADAQEMDALLRSLTSLRAARYIAPAQRAEAAEYGLRPADITARIVVDRGLSAKSRTPRAAEKETIELLVGAACQDHPGERYLQAGDDQPVMCVDDEALAALMRSASGMWDRRPLAIEEHDASRIELRAHGRRLRLERTESGWQLAGPGQKAASQQAVAAWLRDLRQLSANDYEVIAAKTLAARGLSKPVAQLEAVDDDGDVLAELSVGVEQDGQVFARRGDEPVVLSFGTEILALLDVKAEQLQAEQPEASNIEASE